MIGRIFLNLWESPGIEHVTSGLTRVYKPAALLYKPPEPFHHKLLKKLIISCKEVMK